ncbi:MAG TPA: type II secretion system protein GspJ [Kofleriaceae bacterium]|nr:type II secretion system protein GspJ [Kofleriaceae bacterium]
MTSRRLGRHQRGVTLLEIMIALAIMGLMMALTWSTISNSSRAKRSSEAIEARNHELRVALGQVVHDFESAYLSLNEDKNASHRRTLFVSKSGGKVPEMRFSTLNHRVLTADANESEQTQISYLALADRADRDKTNWVRREQRRLSNENPDQEPAEYDVLVHDIEEVKFEFWDWRAQEWRDRWDSTASDGDKDKLPTRVRITLKIPSPQGDTTTRVTQARILMQEALNFSP